MPRRCCVFSSVALLLAGFARAEPVVQTTAASTPCNERQVSILQVQVSDPEWYRNFGAEMQAAYTLARREADRANELFHLSDGSGFRPEHGDEARRLLLASGESIERFTKKYATHYTCVRALFATLDAQLVDNLHNLSMIAMSQGQKADATAHRIRLLNTAQDSRAGMDEFARLSRSTKPQAQYQELDNRMRRREAGAHFLLALDYVSAGDRAKADGHFARAIDLERDPSLKAKYMQLREALLKPR